MLAKRFVCTDNKWNKASRSCDAPEDNYEDADNEIVAGGAVVQTEAVPVAGAEASVPSLKQQREESKKKESFREKQEHTGDQKKEAARKKEKVPEKRKSPPPTAEKKRERADKPRPEKRSKMALPRLAALLGLGGKTANDAKPSAVPAAAATSIPESTTHQNPLPLRALQPAASDFQNAIPRKTVSVAATESSTQSKADIECSIPRKQKLSVPQPAVAASFAPGFKVAIPRKQQQSSTTASSTSTLVIPRRQLPSGSVSGSLILSQVSPGRQQDDESPNAKRLKKKPKKKRRAEDVSPQEEGSYSGSPEKRRPQKSARHEAGFPLTQSASATPTPAQLPKPTGARGDGDVKCTVTGLESLSIPKKTDAVQSTSSSLSEEGEIEDPHSVRAKSSSPRVARLPASQQRPSPQQSQQPQVYQGYSSMASSVLENHKQLQRMQEINAQINAEVQRQRLVVQTAVVQTALQNAISSELQRRQTQIVSAYATMAMHNNNNNNSTSSQYASRHREHGHSSGHRDHYSSRDREAEDQRYRDERERYPRDYERERDRYTSSSRYDYDRSDRDRGSYSDYRRDRYYDRR